MSSHLSSPPFTQLSSRNLLGPISPNTQHKSRSSKSRICCVTLDQVMVVPAVVVVLSGKRKSGKDFIAEALVQAYVLW